MPEEVLENEEIKSSDSEYQPVCLDASRVYDSCGAKDCLRDLTVFFTAENRELIETAASVRVTKVSVVTATVDVDAVAFNRGYYSVDETFYFLCCCEVTSGAGALPTTVTGVAVYSKRVVLFGSDGRVKRFSSAGTTEIDPAELDCCSDCRGSLPEATVQVSSPMALSARLETVTTEPIVPFIPESLQNLLGGALVAPETRQLLVTIGIFSITSLSRDVQMLMPSFDYCMPGKECADREDDPCDAFNQIDFPSDSFFPPSSSDSEPNVNPFNCHCG